MIYGWSSIPFLRFSRSVVKDDLGIYSACLDLMSARDIVIHNGRAWGVPAFARATKALHPTPDPERTLFTTLLDLQMVRLGDSALLHLRSKGTTLPNCTAPLFLFLHPFHNRNAL